MILYHPSNYKFNVVKVSHFGENSYTRNDVRASSILRSFWFDTLPIPEQRFNADQYIYIAEIDDDLIYDLGEDKLKVLQKYATIHQALLFLRELYTGIIYNVGHWNDIAIFKDITPKEIWEKIYAKDYIR